MHCIVLIQFMYGESEVRVDFKGRFWGRDKIFNFRNANKTKVGFI